MCLSLGSYYNQPEGNPQNRDSVDTGFPAANLLLPVVSPALNANTSPQQWSSQSQTAEWKDCWMGTASVRLFWMCIYVSIPPPQTNSNLEKLHTAMGQDKKRVHGKTACRTNNSMPERIINALLGKTNQTKTKQPNKHKMQNTKVRGILVFWPYICISLHLPVIQRYAPFLKFRLQKKPPKCIGIARLPASLI